MPQPEFGGMQLITTLARQGLTVGRGHAAGAKQGITEQRMARLHEMDSKLVRPPGHKKNNAKKSIRPALAHHHVR